jgi:hypothetical protein
MNGEPVALFPAVLEIWSRKPQMSDAHVGHRPAGASDVSRIERADEHDTDVIQRIDFFCFHKRENYTTGS